MDSDDKFSNWVGNGPNNTSWTQWRYQRSETFAPVDTDYYQNEYRWGPHLTDVKKYHYYYDADDNGGKYYLDGGDALTLSGAVANTAFTAAAVACSVAAVALF